MNVRVADYIAGHLRKIGVKTVFLVSGGGMMHLVDALGRAGGCEYLCNHHEQAAAMGAEGYARQSGSLGVCYATSGPGATNILTGLVGAWQDSSPVLFVTGQSKVAQTIRGSGIRRLRQFGTFEVDILSMVESVTKYAAFVDDPSLVRYHLEKAIHMALSGRTGPVLLDVPLDVQGALVDPDRLTGFSPEVSGAPLEDQAAARILEQIRAARRPLILAGHGVRCAGAVPLFREIAARLHTPVVTTQLAKDLLPYDFPLFTGHPGVKGDRAGNFAAQNADLILSVGCSLHTQTLGWEPREFAPRAHKIQVDLDEALLQREQAGVDEKVCCDLVSLLAAFQRLIDEHWDTGRSCDWRQQCADWKNRYHVMNEPHRLDEGPVNFYEFADVLSDALQGDETIVTDAGSAFYVMGQAFRVKESQRYIVSGAMGAMGYALPASIGAATASPAAPVICVTGDGSLQMNVQELQTVRHYRPNVKLFIINNDGYASIRNTQKAFFSGHLVGTGRSSGVSFPPLERLADAYGLPYVRCPERAVLHDRIRQTLATAGPVVCEVQAQAEQEVMPAVSSVKLDNGAMKSKPLDDMFPFLPRDEYARNCVGQTVPAAALDFVS